MKPVEVREQMANALTLDLVGPVSGLAAGAHLEREILPGTSTPSRWYLTGFLAPFESNLEDKSDEDSGEQMDLIPKTTGLDDEATPEASSTRKTPYPSSIGMSVLLPKGTRKITATVTWGDYKPVEDKEEVSGWLREPKWAQVVVPIAGAKAKYRLPDSDGLEIVPSIREVPSHQGLELVPPGTLAVSIFVVNNRDPQPAKTKDTAYAFQVKLQLESDRPFVPRPNLRGLLTEDPDERIADLQYRDAMEFAVGHGTSAHAQVDSEGSCQMMESVWIPRSEVERVEPAKLAGVETKMDALANLADGAQARRDLGGLASQYRDWLAKQDVPSDRKRKEVAELLLSRGGTLAGRIEAGIATLDDAQVMESFRLANKVMSAAARKRNPNEPNPAWRPFQLAFLLLNLAGMADPTHSDRELVDLLFFPTGGGKTEAYLGLAAFTMFLRRLRNAGVAGAGVTVIMRYTLRLLTLDQLGRAAALICAMELERKQDVDKLGTWPFEIGLWVGQAATPNEMGRKGDKSDRTARARTRAFKRDEKHGSPIPLESCPWCGTKFTRNSFTLVPNEDFPIDLRIVCANRRCEFSGDNHLPVLGVDEPIYRRLPAFLIATVDKFANLPWVGPSGKLFGKADRSDKDGFYGPCDPQSVGHKLAKPLLPPELIIQDELHLISGPLGTMVGLYETAIDALCRLTVGDMSSIIRKRSFLIVLPRQHHQRRQARVRPIIREAVWWTG